MAMARESTPKFGDEFVDLFRPGGEISALTPWISSSTPARFAELGLNHNAVVMGVFDNALGKGNVFPQREDAIHRS